MQLKLFEFLVMVERLVKGRAPFIDVLTVSVSDGET